MNKYINFKQNLQGPIGYALPCAALIIIFSMVANRQLITDIDFNLAALIKALYTANSLYVSPIFYFLNEYYIVLCLMPVILLLVIFAELYQPKEKLRISLTYTLYQFSCMAIFVAVNIAINLILKVAQNRPRPHQTK